MGNWWKIARLELRLAVRDRESLVWSLVAPLIMAWLFGNLFEQKPPDPTHIFIDRGDNPAWVETMFAGHLTAKGLVVTDNTEATQVIIPDSLIARLVAGASVEAVVLEQGTSQTRVQQTSVKVREVLYALSFEAREEWLSAPPDSSEITALVTSRGPLSLDTQIRGKAPRMVTGAVHQIPAMLVMFLMFQLTTFFLVLWVEDIRSGKIKRIVMSPTPPRDLFIAQLLSRFAWGLLQVVVILGAGSLLLGVRFEIPWGYFFIMLFAYMITAISLGLLLGTFFRTPEKANAVGLAVGLLLGALGGCWWPLEVIDSSFMRSLALVLPTGAMMDATSEFIALGRDASFPLLNLTILVVMSIVMMPLAIRRMHRQITSQEGN